MPSEHIVVVTPLMSAELCEELYELRPERVDLKDKLDRWRATRYVVGEPAKAPRYVVGETNLTTGGPVLKGKWRPCGAIELEAIELRSAHVEAGQRVTVTGPDGGEAVSITLPQEYRPGDVVRVRLIGDACRTENEETEKVLAKRFGGGMMYGSSCTPPTSSSSSPSTSESLLRLPKSRWLVASSLPEKASTRYCR